MRRPGLPCHFVMRTVGSACLLAMLLLLLPVAHVAGQATGQPSVSPRPQFGAEPGLAPEPLGPHAAMRLEHMREEERRKRLLADTTKLVELSNELKAEVDKTSKDELSVDVVRKAAEIEKLAHDVKERMKS